MKMRSISLTALKALVFIAVIVGPASAATVTIDFEDLNGWDTIGTHYSGLTFSSDAQILQKPNYYWQGYPPHSGNNVFFNMENKNTRIDFATPVSRVGIWYSSPYQGNIEAYDSAGGLIDSAHGGANSGSNSYLEVEGSNIAYVILHDQGDFITYDDLEYDTDSTNTNVPEFPTMALPVVSIIGLMFVISRRKQKN